MRDTSSVDMPVPPGTPNYQNRLLAQYQGAFGNNDSSSLSHLQNEGASNGVLCGESTLLLHSFAYRPVWGAGKHTGVFGRVEPRRTTNMTSNVRFQNQFVRFFLGIRICGRQRTGPMRGNFPAVIQAVLTSSLVTVA